MISFPLEWEPGWKAIEALPAGAVVLIVGASDRGKTTFVQRAARALALSDIRTALIDADIGQSEIGPPGTVGVAAVKRDWATDSQSRLSDLKVGATFFVGAFAPLPVILELVSATAQAVQYARAAKAERILVDTTGFIAGPAARRLKVAKAQAISPQLILGIGPESEIGPLLAAMQGVTGAQIVRLATPNDVGRKSPALRATRRMTRLAKAFEDHREIALPLSSVSFVGCTLGTGDPLTPELVRWTAETLRIPIVRGEQAEGKLTLFSTGRPRTIADHQITPVATYFKVSGVRLVSLSHYTDALIGLNDASGRLLSVGRFLEFDGERDEITVSASPAAMPERVRLVLCGRVRVPADANGYSDIRSGEL